MKGFKGFIFGMSFILNLILGLFTAGVFILAHEGEDIRDYLEPNRKKEIKSESKEGPTIGFHK